MTNDEIMRALAAPFEPWEVREKKGMKYIHATAAQKRLDDVLGIANWRPTYKDVGKGIECTIEVYFEDLGWIAKPDVGGFPGMTVKDRATGEEVEDEENEIKGAYSDAFKRAACVWGVGRYLRFRDAPPPARQGPPAARQDPPRHGHAKERHEWPSAERAREAEAPRSGKALFARIKDLEKEHGEGLLRYVSGWAKLQEFPGRMVDWDASQVELAYGEARRKIREYERSDEQVEALTN